MSDIIMQVWTMVVLGYVMSVAVARDVTVGGRVTGLILAVQPFVYFFLRVVPH